MRDDTEGKAVGTVTPDVRLSGRGARASVSLNARVLYNSLADEDLDCPRGAGIGGFGRFRERFIPSGSFRADFEAVENWLTFDVNASATQNAVNPFAPGGDDALNARGNTNISYRYGAGATAQRRIERSLDFFLRYQYSEQVNTADFAALPDATQDSVQGSLGMVPGAQRLTLSVNGRYTRVSFDESRGGRLRDNELSAAEGQATLQLSDSWQLNGLYGREWNDFLSLSMRSTAPTGMWGCAGRRTPGWRSMPVPASAFSAKRRALPSATVTSGPCCVPATCGPFSSPSTCARRAPIRTTRSGPISARCPATRSRARRRRRCRARGPSRMKASA